MIARFLANSQSAQIDSIHMLAVHAVFYGGIVYLGIKTRKEKLSPKQEIKLRIRYTRINVTALLALLAYILLADTIPKIWLPTPVMGEWMIFSMLIGTSGTLGTLWILYKMKKDHGFDTETQECSRGRKLTHFNAFVDAIGDLAISLLILIAGIAILINPRLYWLDIALSFIASGVILLQIRFLFKSINLEKLSHINHSHN